MPWLSLADAADTSSCSPRTIRRNIERGKLFSKLAGGLRMVWLAEQVHTVSSHQSPVLKEGDRIRLFELYESLSILRMRFERPLEMAAWLERCAPPSPKGDFDNFYQSWRFIFDQLDFCFHQIDTLLTSHELNPTIFRNSYRTLVTLKSYWQESGLHLHEDKVEPPMPEKTKTLALLNDGLAHVRRLLLLCPQPSSSETLSQALVVQEGIVNEGSHSHAVAHEDLVSPPPMEERAPITGAKKKTSSKKGRQQGQTQT